MIRDNGEIRLKSIEMAGLRREADTLLTGVKLLNVFTGEVTTTNVALGGGRIVGIGSQYRRAQEVFDLYGKYVLPGLIEGHIHIESSLLTPEGFAEAVVPRGTTAVIADPHEIANVLGLDGVRYMLRASQDLPLDCYFMASSCVPATELETAGASLGLEAIGALLEEDRVLGLAEVMDYPGVIHGRRDILEKIALARSRGKVVNGHAPHLTGEGLMAYLGAGIGSDHESTTLEEAQEKLRLGMRVMIREGSQARNLAELLPLVTPVTGRRCLLVSDDKEPHELVAHGHLDALLRRAVSMGLSPHLAVQLVTLNVAEAFGLRDRGALAPGYLADLVVVDNLREFIPLLVFKGGRLVAEEGKLLREIPRRRERGILDTVRIPPLSTENLRIPVRGTRFVRVIGLVPGQITTRRLVLEALVADGEVCADPARDILKLVVVERHGRNGNIGLGLVQGFGLRQGALASSVAHDSHNLIAVGVEERDLLTALEHVAAIGGGLAVAARGEILASLSLPVAGLMSEEKPGDVAAAMEHLLLNARDLGCIAPNPFAALSFLALPVIPEIRLTDRGLVNVGKGEFLSLAFP
ncbi:MAG: adenine deaminase [Candidatus Methylomirabilales bacterium]